MNKAIFGAGAFGSIFFDALDRKINFFIDENYINETYKEIPVKKLAQISKDTKIYISVLQSSKQIKEKLEKKGYKNIYSFSDSIKEFPKILKILAKKNYLWLIENKTEFIDYRSIAKFRKLLKDEKSKLLLDKIVKFRETLDPKYYIEPYDDEYFPSDVPIFNNLENINFIDCGAYTGDSVKKLLSTVKKVDIVISFEPDINNLDSLNSEIKIQKNKYPDTKFIIFPSGVFSANKILCFSNEESSSSSCISNKTENFISVVSIDKTIKNMNPNYIKMDIEGVEYEAILGAKETIKKYKPNLAICLYHKPEDLWELPLLINKIEPNYKMYLRVHEDLCLSTVLYCIYKK